MSTGAGAIVAVVDTGIDASHPDLQGRIGPGFDFVDGDSTPQDGNGHGTHVAGIIAADANNGVGVDSVAPGAEIMPVRVLDSSGSGSVADVAKGIDWAVDHGADVINLSLGGTVPTSGLGIQDDISSAVQRAVSRGVVVVAAAGNDGLPFCENNSEQGKVLCVGAVDKRGNRSFFSSFGAGLSLVAPGGSGMPGTDEDILSTWNNGGYQELAGTSQATPHVAGVAALLVSLGVRGQAAVQRILATATDLGAPGPDPVYGAGLVNAQAAVAGLGPPPGSQGAGGVRRRSAHAHISLRRVQSIRSVLRHGIRVTCSGASGRCSVSASYRHRRIARGSAKLAAGRRAHVRARLNRRGRGVLRRALRSHRRLRVTVVAHVPGHTIRRRVLLVS
ncbi:MAG TPA: S8 family peptidase [Thermoleophilaceae bacterium]|nr:S8 family peptidase [Thermoleophilaceae bacterium]